MTPTPLLSDGSLLSPAKIFRLKIDIILDLHHPITYHRQHKQALTVG